MYRSLAGATAIAIALGGCGGTETDHREKVLLHASSMVSAVSTPYSTAVQQLYVAYFGRPADPQGLANFSAALTDANAPSDIQDLNKAYSSNPTVRQLVDAFGNSVESNNLYTGDTRSFVTAIYRNVLNRAPDPGGLDFWVNAIDHGGLSKGNASLSIMAGALANTTAEGRVDAATISNKIAVSTGFTAALNPDTRRSGYAGDAAAAVARNMLAMVTENTDASAFVSEISTAVASLAPAISDYAAQDVTSKLSLAGIWTPVETAETPVVDFWNIVRLGSQQLQGIALTGWAYTGFDNTAADVTSVRVALLAQQSDGTLALATNQFLPSPITNGAGSVITADFNGDGKDDIFLAAHNESPFVAKASTVYLSKPDSSFSKVTLNDSVMAHHTSLAMMDGKPAVLAASYNEKMANPIYTYNGAGGFDINNSSGFVSAMSVAAGDFLGNGKTQVIYGDAIWGLDLPYETNGVMQQYAYSYADGKISAPKTALPAPYFNNKPQYSQFESHWGVSKTHNSRLWVDDINQDGKQDVVVGGEIWSASLGLQKTVLQLLINHGNLAFVDKTDSLMRDYNQDVFYDYSLRMADADQSGIKTYFASERSQGYFVDTKYVTQKARHGNYVLVNDGTGQFHVAMHDEFIKLGDYVNAYVASQFPSDRYFVRADGDVPRFIAYQAASGAINFLAVVSISEKVNGSWFQKYALVNVPLAIDLPSQYKHDIVITNRNGSRNIRTFAGDDVIYASTERGECTIDGGFGRNTAVYSGKRSNYTITKDDHGFIVKDTVGNGGTDRLRRIQTLKFADMTLALQ